MEVVGLSLFPAFTYSQTSTTVCTNRQEACVAHAVTGVSHIFSVQLHSLMHSQAFISMKQTK